MSLSRNRVYAALSFTRIAAALVLALVVTPQPARAADDAEAEKAKPAPAPEPTFKEQVQEVWNRDLFLGDWQGLRTQLHDHGIDVGLRLSMYGQGVTSGGVDKNGEYGGTMDYRIHSDLRKLFGLWEGLTLDVHARTRFGHDVNEDAGAFALPNAGLMMPLPGGYDGTDVTGLTLNQMFPAYSGRIGLATLGKLDIIDALTLFFPSVSYGQEGFWNVNALVSALPWFGAVDGLSLYGGWLATINEEYGMGESAFLFTGTENVTTQWSSIEDSFKDGAWFAAFHRFFWKLEDKTGYFMLFAGGSTREQPSNDPNDHLPIPGEGIVSTDEERPWDIAAYVYQTFWQAEKDPNRKATILMGGTGGPDNPQFAQYNFFASVEAHGPMASRPHDRMGVSGWKNWLSDDFEELVSPVANVRDTYGFELYYNVAVNQWLHVTPDLQFVENERNGDNLAVIAGLRMVMDL